MSSGAAPATGLLPFLAAVTRFLALLAGLVRRAPRPAGLEPPASGAAPNPATNPAVDAAARRVVDQLGIPLHERATVAALESEGLRDKDAPGIDPSCPDLFALGALVHRRALTLEAPARAAEAAGRPVRPLWRRAIAGYWRGVAYLLPLMAQGVAVAVLGVSLWGSAGLAPAEQTAVGVALVVTLVVTGPLSHAMVRRLFHYWFAWDVQAVRRTGMRWIAGGALTGPLIAGPTALALLATGRLTTATATFAIFTALQPAIWMASAALVVIGAAWIAAVALLVPTVPLWLALEAGAPPLLAHTLAMAGAAALLAGGTALALRRRATGWPAARRPLPRRVLPIAVGGHAAWGLVYFLFIFGDRAVAWADADAGLVFRPSYEAALQLALVPLLLVLPLLEQALASVGARFDRMQRDTAPRDLAAANRGAARLLERWVAGAVGAYAALAVAVWVVVDRAGPALPLGAGRLVGEGAPRAALATALVAYGCVTAALGVCAAYQLLARPWPMVTAGALALVADLGVGITARSAGPPEAAAAGLLAGAVVFALAIGGLWMRDRRRLDHLWYAAS